jgi:hypothetical protein
MRRSQRAVHRALWPLLALAVLLGLVLALAWRPAPAAEPKPAELKQAEPKLAVEVVR